MKFNDIEWPEALFVSGIGTDVGKSYATGWLGAQMLRYGLKTITQKFIQTGSSGVSIDIECHRRLMGLPMLPEDIEGTTAPISFTYPASPHLAAAIDKREIHLELASEATAALLRDYDHVLIEGAGGLMVPISDEMLTIDYIREHQLPAILVTNGQLGSISDTLLSLEALTRRDIRIFAVIYNPFFDSDRIIADDAREYMRRFCARHYPDTLWIEMPR